MGFLRQSFDKRKIMEIKIRHAEKEDTVSIKAIYEQPHAIEGTLQLPYPSLSQWESRFEKWGENMQNLLAVHNEKVVGQLGLQFYPGQRRKHAATFGMAVCSSVLGQGVGRVLLNAAIDSCDNWLNISRLELLVFVDNESAIRLYKSSGFVVEGTNKNFAYKAGQYVDVYSMARIRN